MVGRFRLARVLLPRACSSALPRFPRYPRRIEKSKANGSGNRRGNDTFPNAQIPKSAAGCAASRLARTQARRRCSCAGGEGGGAEEEEEG